MKINKAQIRMNTQKMEITALQIEAKHMRLIYLG